MSKLSNRGELWEKFLQTQPDPAETEARFFESFHFSSSRELANELAGLVVKGVKTATSALVWENEVSGQPTVQPGNLSIVTDWDGHPVCIMETTEVRILPFNEVDAQFVYDYGEEERTLEWWQTVMWESYTRICTELGKEPRPDMPVICERFRVVYP